jgi:hypothetical protein
VVDFERSVVSPSDGFGSGAPTVGVAILVGVALFGWRLWQARAAGEPVGED